MGDEMKGKEMVDLNDVFLAGLVHRWHTNPHLAHTHDRLDGHAGRVARILLAMHPDPSVALLRAALTHDDGESVSGDIPGPTKRAYPEYAQAAEVLERAEIKRLWPNDDDDDLTLNDARWLQFADRLDAYQWAAHFAPQRIWDDGWLETRAWIMSEARALGVEL